MGVRKWLEKSAEKQKYKLCKTLNPLSRKAFRAVSFSATKDKKKGLPIWKSFLFGLRSPKAASALRYFKCSAEMDSSCAKALITDQSADGQKLGICMPKNIQICVAP